jgi:hypothetical protein
MACYFAIIDATSMSPQKRRNGDTFVDFFRGAALRKEQCD